MNVAIVLRSFFSLDELIANPALAAQVTLEYEALDKLLGHRHNRPHPAPAVRHQKLETDYSRARRRLAALSSPSPAPVSSSAPATDLEMARERLSALGYQR